MISTPLNALRRIVPLFYLFLLAFSLLSAPAVFAAPRWASDVDFSNAALSNTWPLESGNEAEDESHDEIQDESEDEAGIFVGAELYGGFSNLEGQKKFRDEFWESGSGLSSPCTRQ
jgi:hypothetical protein